MNTDRLRIARPRALLRQGRDDWYSIKNLAESTDTAEVWIYDEIGWFGVTAQDFVNDLRGISAGHIDLHLNTPGGDVFDGLAILEALRSHQASVTVYVDSLAASIGSVIAMAGDRVVMARNASMMIHDGHGLSIGNAADMREMADLLDKCSDNIASVYADRAGGSVEDWRAAMRATTWYSAQEAVDAGLADEVKPGSGKRAADNSWDLSIFGGAPDGVFRVNPENVTVDREVLGDATENPGHAGSRRREASAEVVDRLSPIGDTGPHSTVVDDGTDDRADPPAFQFDADLFRTAVKEAAL